MSEDGSGTNHDYLPNSLTNGSHHHIQRLDDGTIEVTDTLSKQDYYRSLRRLPGGTGNGPASMGLASQLSLDLAHGGTLKSSFGRKNGSVLGFKPSGKEEVCYVLMLEGVERTFSIDRNAYGSHLFEKVCRELDLYETEYFGMTYRNNLRVDNWLKMDKRISKQLEKQPWKLEFHFRYYPPNIDEFKDDLTRYLLCLQIRQDIISGQLPCSFQTYVMLGAYAVQSEAGDYDPINHAGIEYISSMPFAPQTLQTPKMLQRIVELHKMHKGQTPVQADRGFLENARRLALYGVEFHKAKFTTGEDVSIGVYHGGILIYRGRVRIGRFLWPQLVKLLYKAKTFTIVTRAINVDLKIQSASLAKSSGLLRGEKRRSNDLFNQLFTLNFQCADPRLSRRLWESCTAQHSFFRLREPPGPQRANLITAFNSRKYHYPNKTGGLNSRSPSTEWNRRPQPQIQRVPTQRKPAQYASSGMAPVAFNEEPDQFYIIPGSPSPLPANTINMSALQNLPPAYRRPGPTRTPLAQENWQMSPADCTQGLGMNSDGTDVAAMHDTDWQGCRANRGLKWPGAYFYEAVMLEEGQIRLGWSTNDSSLILGTDCNGFGYGADETGAGSAARLHPTGRFVHANVSEEYGVPVVPGDVVGCYLELENNTPEGNRLTVQWSYNGRLLDPPKLKQPLKVTDKDALFPAASLKDARVGFNFGYKPFSFPPKHSSRSGHPWTPVALVEDSRRVGNWNVGWRVNPGDVSSSTNLVVSPNGRMVQAVENTGWQGFRANKGIFGGGKYYYEIECVEDSGLARVGWSLDGANLDLGLDGFGYGFGADRDGFGITGLQGKKLHADVIENYGEAFGKDDVIGCFLDLDSGVLQWSKNGRMFGPAYWLREDQLKQSEPIYPAASLVDTTLELNYGDLPFKFPPEGDWIPLFAAPDQNIFESPAWPHSRATDRLEKCIAGLNIQIQHQRGRPEPPVRSSSRISQNWDHDSALNPVRTPGLQQTHSPMSDIVTQEDEVHTFDLHDEEILDENDEKMLETDVDQSDQLLPRSASFQHAVRDHSEEVEVNSRPNGVRFGTDADKALHEAILQTTHLSRDTAVLSGSVGVVTKSNGRA
ncbi:SPRY domain containing protein [Fasciolopsis buskii]|uniref:SPRY domain containing protein n=1 Tax=Fasciolopsis buskii TaxID=27845 RepID=A0A8E0RPR4_9TREM|nr:SPRY domain containing protein [Fasciolopsis buski]